LSVFYHKKPLFIFNFICFCFLMSFNNKFLAFFASFAVICIVVSSLVGTGFVQKLAQAALVQACTASETLEGSACTFTKTSTPKYETKCAAGYTVMDATCSKFTAQPCTAFVQAIAAENGQCKIDLSDPTKPIYLTEINDYDGRQCNGVGTDFKRYNVNQERNSTIGPIICGNNFSALDKAGFRFMPRVITEISNFQSIKTEDVTAACPTGYTELAPNKCSRPAVAQSCNAGGEIFVNNACVPCPAGKYCPVDGVVAKTVTVCANGGTLSGNVCTAPVKYPVTHYTDGCTAEYVKYDQSCAVVQVRTHDTGCSYFYTSENVNVTATIGADGYCTTGGRTDFATTSITRVSDFNCAGPGTYYYNYNVAFDPLVCGNDYTVVGKLGFKWLPTTFTKITALQKIPSISYICPTGWVSYDNSNNCSQAPITQEYKNPVNCPVNTYCPGGNPTPIPCPAGTVSPAMSVAITDCVAIVCTNGTTNYPACNVCPTGYIFQSSVCVPVVVCSNGFVTTNNTCVCPSPKIVVNSTCVTPVVCDPSFTVVNNACVCPSPKVVTNGKCQTPVVVVDKATISGYSYVDSNDNGIFDNGETPISGVTVTLIGTGNDCKTVNQTTTTDANGFYKFSNLIGCTYSVVQTQPTDYNNGKVTIGTIDGFSVGTQTVINRIDNIEIFGGDDSIKNNFGELIKTTPVVCDPSYTVVNNACVCPSPKVVTNGKCQTPVVVIDCVNGYTNVNNTCVCVSPKIVLNANCVPVVVCDSSFTVTNNTCVCASPKVINNGKCETPVVTPNPATVSGYSYVDTNNNGIFDNGETPLANVTITLIGIGDNCKNVNLSTTTDANGFYKFSNLVACKYSVVQTQPTNYNNGKVTVGTINGVTVGTQTVINRIDDIVVNANDSINNNFGETAINPACVNGYTLSANTCVCVSPLVVYNGFCQNQIVYTSTPTGTVVNITNNPVNNNTNTNTVSAPSPVAPTIVYQAPAAVTQLIPAPRFTPLATPVPAPVYYSSPVVTVTETIRSGGLNVFLILGAIISAAAAGLIYSKGKRNKGFNNYNYQNIED
jgi:SdrD B-like domain